MSVLSKAGFRIEGGSVSGTGLPSSEYPETIVEADAEEVKLGCYDQVPFTSEDVKVTKQSSQDETYLGDAGTPGIDFVAIQSAGQVNCAMGFDGLVALIAAAMGFEYPGTNTLKQLPDYTIGDEIDDDVDSATSTQVVSTGTPFDAGDVGKFIYFYGNKASSGQIRRITVVNASDTITITPAFDVTPSAGDTFIVASEFEHFFELTPQLNDQLWTSVFPDYPTVGVLTALDKIIRRGTFGVLKDIDGNPDITRCCMVNGMNLSLNQKGRMEASFGLIGFDLDIDSATNPDLDDLDFFNLDQLIELADFSMAEFSIKPFSISVALASSDKINITSFQVGLNNSLSSDDFGFKSTPYIIQPSRAAKREVSGEITVPRYSDQIFKDWYDAETLLMAKIVFTGTTIDTINQEFTIWIPALKLITFDNTIVGSPVTTQKIRFQAITPQSYQAMIFDDAKLVADSAILVDATDYEIEVKVSYDSVTAINQILFGETANAAQFLLDYVSASSIMYCRLYNVATTGSVLYAFGGIALTADTDYIFILKKAGTTLSLSIDGVPRTDITIAAGLSSNIDEIAGYSTTGTHTNDFIGTMYYAKIWSGGDRNTGTLETNLVGKDDAPLDLSETHTFTKYVSGAGDITYEDIEEPAAGFPVQYLKNPRSEMMISMKNQYPFNPFLDQNREY